MDIKINSIMKPGIARYADSVKRTTVASSVSQSADKVDLSESGRLFAQALKAAKDSEPVRADLVASIKARIDNGSYKIDSRAIAEKLINQ